MSHERTLDEQLIMLRLAARVDPLLREAVADVDDAVATLTAERDQWKSMLESERDEQGRAWGKDVAMTELRAQVDALRTALEGDPPYPNPPSTKRSDLLWDEGFKAGWLAAREALGGKS